MLAKFRSLSLSLSLSALDVLDVLAGALTISANFVRMSCSTW